jgi:glycosyltransferase involved in cell wall biosynthesis
VNRYAGRLGLQQRVLPSYRVVFFDALAESCQRGLSVFAGKPLPQEQIAATEQLHVAGYAPARNRHFMDPGSPLYRCWQPGILNWLEEWQPDVLVVEANPRYPTTRAAIRWMHARARPVIGWGLGAPPAAGWLAGWRERARLSFLRMLDGWIAYSQHGAEEYLDLGFPEQRVFVARNAAVLRPLYPPDERPAQFQEEPQVLFVGRLQSRKRIDLLLQACAILPDALQPALWIVGDGPARADLQRLAEQIYPRAQFTGARHGDQLEAYFDRSDLFVLPGTGGLAVQQAMAKGLPVIVAEGDGTQDDLVRPANGWLVQPGSLEALVVALGDALSDPQRLRRMGRESYRIVAEEANVQQMVAAFLQALEFVTKPL